MIDNAIFLAGSYAAIAAGLSMAIGRFSPTIGPRMRHLFAGVAPLAAVFAARLTETDSVTLYGMDLLAAGGLVALGVVTSNMAGKFISRGETGSSVRISRRA